MLIKIVIALVACALVFSCQKEKGCTDFDATNFNMEAEKNDGSCEYLFVSLMRVYLDSTHQLLQDTSFMNEEHTFIVKVTSDRYSGPDSFVLESRENEWQHTVSDEIVITNEEWNFDIYFDDLGNPLAAFSSKIYFLVTTSPFPNIAGIGFEQDGLHFEFFFKR